MSDYPEFAYKSLKHFRVEKRKAIRSVLKEINNSQLMLGSMYSPAYEDLREAVRLLERAKTKMSVKEWG